jgi:hypothetical protein
VIGQLHAPADLHPGKSPYVPTGEKAVLGRGEDKFLPLPGFELRLLGRPTRSQSLNELSTGTIALMSFLAVMERDALDCRL